MQQTLVHGFVGRDCELRFTPNGTPVADFSIASSDYIGKNSDGSYKYKTTWFKVTLWDAKAEGLSPKIKKGMKMLVIGRLKSNDKGNPIVFQRNDGTHGSKFEFDWVDKIEFGEKAGNGSSSSEEEEEDDEIPF